MREVPVASTSAGLRASGLSAQDLFASQASLPGDCRDGTADLQPNSANHMTAASSAAQFAAASKHSAAIPEPAQDEYAEEDLLGGDLLEEEDLGGASSTSFLGAFTATGAAVNSAALPSANLSVGTGSVAGPATPVQTGAFPDTQDAVGSGLARFAFKGHPPPGDADEKLDGTADTEARGPRRRRKTFAE